MPRNGAKKTGQDTFQRVEQGRFTGQELVARLDAMRDIHSKSPAELAREIRAKGFTMAAAESMGTDEFVDIITDRHNILVLKKLMKGFVFNACTIRMSEALSEQELIAAYILLTKCDDDASRCREQLQLHASAVTLVKSIDAMLEFLAVTKPDQSYVAIPPVVREEFARQHNLYKDAMKDYADFEAGVDVSRALAVHLFTLFTGRSRVVELRALPEDTITPSQVEDLRRLLENEKSTVRTLVNMIPQLNIQEIDQEILVCLENFIAAVTSELLIKIHGLPEGHSTAYLLIQKYLELRDKRDDVQARIYRIERARSSISDVD